MWTAVVRVKNEHESWWDNIMHLLSGHGVHHKNPEKIAMQNALNTLQENLTTASVNPDDTTIGLALSHEGAGSRRAVTVIAFANRCVHPESNNESSDSTPVNRSRRLTKGGT